jgi:endonuclease/exonuclease/phosphatase family metal-dependent hydrolase
LTPHRPIAHKIGMRQQAASCSFITLNLFADLPAFRHLDRRLEIAASAIAAEQPAIVALQEIVRARACGDMGRKLCELVNRYSTAAEYQLHYAQADGFGEDEWKFDEGVALMSHHQRVSQEISVFKFSSQVRLTASVGKQQYRLPDDRVAMHIRYAVAPGIELDAYVTHLTDRSDQSGGIAIKIHQARELIQWVQRTSRSGNPVLMGGDFNDIPESETIRTLTGSGFIDLHAAAGSGPGYTNDRNDLDIEAPQASPNQRIDYIFFRPADGRRFTIESVGLFLDQPLAESDGRWLWASDHFGVMARLVLY